jgi:hypothetical protein
MKLRLVVWKIFKITSVVVVVEKNKKIEFVILNISNKIMIRIENDFVSN